MHRHAPAHGCAERRGGTKTRWQSDTAARRARRHGSAPARTDAHPVRGHNHAPAMAIASIPTHGAGLDSQGCSQAPREEDAVRVHLVCAAYPITSILTPRTTRARTRTT